MFDIQFIKDLQDSQRSNFYRAKVISLDDPLKLNRIQIMIFGLTDDIELTSQPWCELEFKDGVITYPSLNDIIWLFFEGGDIFRPIYLGTIYSGLNASCDEGWNRFISSRPVALSDPDTYKTTLRNVNNLATPEDKLIIQDIHQQFNNTIILEDSPFYTKFTGSNEEKTDTFTTDEPLDLELQYDITYNTIHKNYRKNFPSTFVTAPDKMYPWYIVEDVPEGKDWRSALGGWTFYTAADIEKGLLVFPDNLRFINYKRYKNWSSLLGTNGKLSAYVELDSHSPGELSKRPSSWEFIPMSPWLYWTPEMMGYDIAGYAQTMSFPFGKMNMKSWKYYKQHTFLSHDGKSAIELDDNDNYERLKIDFNYSAGGLEFSRAGFNGVELWTDGVIKFQSEGKMSDGNGGYLSETSANNRFTFNNANIRIDTNRKIQLMAKEGQRYSSMGDAELRSKYGITAIIGGEGVTLSSLFGADALMNRTSPATEGMFFGQPMITATGTVTSSLQGYFPYLNSADGFSDGEAKAWINFMNSALYCIYKFCEAITLDYVAKAAMPINMATVSSRLLMEAQKGFSLLSSWAINEKGFDLTKLAGAWEGIQIQGSRS